MLPTAGPSAATGAAVGIHSADATLAGSVTARSQPTTYHFDWGLTSAYGASTPETSAGSEASPEAITSAVAGLAPSTVYHFRIVATNGGGNYCRSGWHVHDRDGAGRGATGFRLDTSHSPGSRPSDGLREQLRQPPRRHARAALSTRRRLRSHDDRRVRWQGQAHKRPRPERQASDRDILGRVVRRSPGTAASEPLQS